MQSLDLLDDYMMLTALFFFEATYGKTFPFLAKTAERCLAYLSIYLYKVDAIVVSFPRKKL